ncbi:unnamed protein product [Closterium sp. NIES-54]
MDCADPRDQDINDLTLAAQGENRGVLRVVGASPCCSTPSTSAASPSAPPKSCDTSVNSEDEDNSIGMRSGSLVPTSIPSGMVTLLLPRSDHSLNMSSSMNLASMCPQQGVDFFQTFSPTPKMTTLRVLLHVAAQRDYELHSLDFSTAFLQGSLHEEIWLRRPPGFTGTFPAGTQWSLRRPVYGLRQAPREWHDTLRTTLASLGFAPSAADPSLFLCTDTTLPPFYVLVYVDDLIFVTADTEALAHVKSELQKRHSCIDLGRSKARRRRDTKNLLKQGNEVRSRPNSASSTSTTRHITPSSSTSSSSASCASASSSSANCSSSSNWSATSASASSSSASNPSSSRMCRVSSSSAPNTTSRGSSIVIPEPAASAPLVPPASVVTPAPPALLSPTAESPAPAAPLRRRVC